MKVDTDSVGLRSPKVTILLEVEKEIIDFFRNALASNHIYWSFDDDFIANYGRIIVYSFWLIRK